MLNNDRQKFSVKKGEVTFRQKLASQQLKNGKIVFPDTHTYDEMLETMRQRAATTHQAMARLSARGLQFTPFIELGAERCQRDRLGEVWDAYGERETYC